MDINTLHDYINLLKASNGDLYYYTDRTKKDRVDTKRKFIIVHKLQKRKNNKGIVPAGHIFLIKTEGKDYIIFQCKSKVHFVK